MAILYDPPAAAAVLALLDDLNRKALADRVHSALTALNHDPRQERFGRRSFAPVVDWGFVVRARDDELLILWDWDAEAEAPRVRYVGPDL